MNRMKKGLCLFLAICMLLTAIPMGALATPRASDGGFSDLSPDSWAYSYIMDLGRRGIINGFPDGTYRPQASVTRAQFARLVVALLETPTETEAIFDDVPENSWSNPYITAAVRRGILFPSEYGRILGANEAITREEAAVWMVRALGIGLIDGSALDFVDRDAITFQDEIATAVEIGLIVGLPDNRFGPEGSTTRAQAANRSARPLVFGSGT